MHRTTLPSPTRTHRIALGDAAGTVIGDREIVVMAGPCSVEGHAMLRQTALGVRDAGARVLRGGAFKPRTSPHEFRGHGATALRQLSEVRAESSLPVVTEVLDPRQVELVAGHADILQIGARNMQNFALLSEVGRVHRPVLLKRGPGATIRELLLAAEYILTEGNPDVILCERGLRTFDTATRNIFDLTAIPLLKAETHLPVFADPSHACGRADLVPALALAAVAAGADGLIVEVHPEPAKALSDGAQSLTIEGFAEMMPRLRAVADAVGRRIPAGAAVPGRTATEHAA